MRIGQTSVIHFGSRLLASMLGFASTLYIARMLGADVLGIYSLGLTVVSWLGITANLGISGAIRKRVSEDEEPGSYAVAGAFLVTGIFVVLAGAILLFESLVNDYVGIEAAEFIVLMLAASLSVNVVMSILDGRKLVHISGLLSPVKTGGRAGLQIVAILIGFGVIGLFGGYILGYAVVAALATYVIVRDIDNFPLPGARHFRSLASYAKFAWLGNLRSKAFNWVDIAVLGFFVSDALIGYYTAAWNLAQFLIIFGGSVSRTLFPEMSNRSAQSDPQKVANLVNASMSYAGLILIPGLVGGLIIGNRILRIYGDGFVEASTVLAILIVASLIQAYQAQLTNTLNAVDRPDLSFRVNAVFVGSNLLLNIVLIYLFGMLGAAVATALSVAISCLVAYLEVISIVDFNLPYRELVSQWMAAGIMGVLVYLGLQVEVSQLGIQNNVVVVLTLVGLGGVTYFASLFALSSKFRQTVISNLPEKLIPY